jgi:hypothetical protein
MLATMAMVRERTAACPENSIRALRRDDVRTCVVPAVKVVKDHRKLERTTASPSYPILTVCFVVPA